MQLINYPIRSGAVFIAINRLNANTYAEILNNRFLNIDRTPLTVRGFINATIEFNRSINGSGRSIGNTAACFIEGTKPLCLTQLTPVRQQSLQHRTGRIQ